MANGLISGKSQVKLRSGRSKTKGNSSILSFFQKVEQSKDPRNQANASTLSITDDNDDLFMDQVEQADLPARIRSATPEIPRDSTSITNGSEESTNLDVTRNITTRYNEDRGPTKRRRLGSPEAQTSPSRVLPEQWDSVEDEGVAESKQASRPLALATTLVGDVSLVESSTRTGKDNVPEIARSESSPTTPGPTNLLRGDEQLEKQSPQSEGAIKCQRGHDKKPVRRHGPFLDDDDSDVDFPGEETLVQDIPVSAILDDDLLEGKPARSNSPVESPQLDEGMKAGLTSFILPSLKREATSIYDEPDEFDGIDFDDEFAEGEEYVERRMLAEQRRLEMVENGLEEFEDKTWSSVVDGDGNGPSGKDSKSSLTDASDLTCPICATPLSGLTSSNAQLHVNGCLDGHPILMPEQGIKSDVSDGKAVTPSRIQHLSRPAKPAQPNPFEFGTEKGRSGSAFAKLMSSHAEDAAWATAAAAEQSSRGKPAFQRTCPFYKILPGFSICVDAFRYGAVEGCQAYFLSHFHSDHYVGLTASWVHGPIFCSRITGNLVRQQLRVDAKYVVDLRFEEKVEVPGTNGVHVTMIPANHCPGSSLFLFEKAMGKGKNTKVHRVLHCGDFRACPAHIQHPLLRPEILDNSTGKSIGQQTIDVCYLDTTYLNPKYAFPSQQQVIDACAAMCVSLHKEQLDNDDEWELMKRRAESGMTKFLAINPDASVKEGQEGDHGDAIKANIKNSPKNRGRLLVVVGTYSIGKERICMGIARALDSKIFAPTAKQRICACLEDAELNARLTTDPLSAQVHMTPLFEIRADTLQEYLNAYKPHFSRVVGFRPSGWTYKPPPHTRLLDSSLTVPTVLHSPHWRSPYTLAHLQPQRGSTPEASCFGVPYSEHSSFRELTLFCCALRIEKIIPTVNVGSAKSRERMKGWFDKWAAERKRNGFYRLEDGRADDADW